MKIYKWKNSISDTLHYNLKRDFLMIHACAVCKYTCLFITHSKTMIPSVNNKTLIHAARNGRSSSDSWAHAQLARRGVYQSWKLRQTRWYSDGNPRSLFQSTKGRERLEAFALTQTRKSQCNLFALSGSSPNVMEVFPLNVVSFSFLFSSRLLIANTFPVIDTQYTQLKLNR